MKMKTFATFMAVAFLAATAVPYAAEAGRGGGGGGAMKGGGAGSMSGSVLKNQYKFQEKRQIQDQKSRAGTALDGTQKKGNTYGPGDGTGPYAPEDGTGYGAPASR